MKRILVLFLISITLVSCDINNDCGDCFSPPRQFNFDFVDATTLENLFLNNTFSKDAIKVYDETNKAVEFELVFYKNHYILALNKIGWELEDKTYTIELSSEVSVVFELDMDKSTSECCTFYEVKKFIVKDYEFKELLPSGIIQIKID